MRSHLLTRRTRSLVRTLPKFHRAQISSTQALRYPRKDRAPSQSTTAPRFSKRAISSETPANDQQEGSGAVPPVAPATPPNATDPPPSEDAEEKPKRRARVAAAKETDSVSFPASLNILWTPEEAPGGPPPSHAEPTTLPPPDIFNEALHNLHIVLHPQTQHRATYASGGGPLIEPTLALYCPIEGGDYILDETVREMARQTGADVVILDAVQLAAGECGNFGKAASVLHLPNNPLHFPSSASRDVARPVHLRESEEEEDEPSPPFLVSPMTVHVMTAIPRRSGRALEVTPRSTPLSKLKTFFDELVNLPPSPPPVVDGEEPPSGVVRRPRIIYIRDYPTLAASSSAWYPALLAAVRQRRQGPLARSSAPVLNPTAIVFGISPSFMVPETPSHAPTPSLQGLNLLSSRPTVPSTAMKPHNEYGEDRHSEKAREKRVQRRLKRWARGSSEDLPQLYPTGEESMEGDGPKGRPNVVVLGQEGFSGLPPFLGSAVSRMLAGRNHGSPESDSRLGFFRMSLVFPTLRSLPQERESRMARRREINELVMRMGVAAVGGMLGEMEAGAEFGEEAADGGSEHDGMRAQLWEHWGRTVEVWPNVQRIADRAVGSVMAASRAYLPSNRSLDPTHVPWSAVFDAWAADRSTQDLWKTLFSTQPSGKLPRENEEEERAEVQDEVDVDEIIEKLRRNPDLDEHEQRLLGCIVDTASITTTFSQVHLPSHTIDSIRTMVSLPLLHPGAFQHGILKEHSMTGCLLFGPPGTGKTLVVRALAKEAGCRMLVVSPSDIMDMYVGEGEKLVRAVFSLARRLSPCVVFIDELDALFGARLSRESGSSLAHRGVITEFMQEMDGLKSSKDNNVVVIGATNRPFDLDDAVLRRLPRRLLVDLPGEKEREEILKILLRDETLKGDVDLKQLAKKTESFSGSDLKHLCVSAALDAVKERVTVPWRQSTAFPPSSSLSSSPPVLAETQSVEERECRKEQPQSESSIAEVLAAPVREQAAAPSGSDPLVSAVQDQTASEVQHARSLARHNFEQALKEITPSASEALGSLAELRKWNEEFGEGRRTRKRQVWGKDRFGFTVPTREITPSEVKLEPGVGTPAASNGMNNSSISDTASGS